MALSRWMLPLLATFAAMAVPVVPAMAATDCDRACLIGTMDRYLGALEAHDPKRLPFSPDLRFTENGVVLRPGQALWGTMQGLKSYRQYFADPRGGAVAFVGTIDENGQDSILSVRLKVVDGAITEAEHIVNRQSDEARKLDALAVDPIWDETLKPGERAPRDRMIAIANSYFTAIEKGAGTPIPFDDSCNRVENGVPTVHNPALDRPDAMVKVFALGCRDQLGLKGFFAFNTELRDRRFLVVDEEKGIVFAHVFFDKDGTVGTLKLADGREMPTAAIMRRPWSMQMHEVFKIRNGKIYRIEATWIHNNFGQPSGWEQGGHD